MKTKNFLLGMLAVAGMLFATSCSQDDVNGSLNDDFVNASFTIGAANGIGTRTAGDGTTVDKVVCAVYDVNGVELTELRQTLDLVEKAATYNVRLAKGQNYRAAFFAYNEAAQAYDVTDLKSVKILANQASNVEGRDAFTAYEDIASADLTNMSKVEKTIELKRPFAQLNLGIDAEELEDARKAGIVVANTQITVSNVYDAFNAFDNTVAEDATLGSMTFALNGMPAEKLVVDGEKYTYLALNYLLVGDKGAEKGLSDVEFVWATADGKTNNPTTHFINIPVQRNYRTNIIGRLLTTPAQFNIVVDADFDGEYVENIVATVTEEVTTAEDLQAAINAAGEGRTIIKLGATINDNVNIVVNQKKNVEILVDGQGNWFFGTFTVNGGSVWGGTEGLTLENIKFRGCKSNDDYVTVGENVAGNMSRYAHNVIIKNCIFSPFITGPGISENIVAVRAYQANDILIMDCKAYDLHSFAQITGGNNVKVSSVYSECVRGISLGSATNCFIHNSEFIATGDGKYGIRHNADSKTDVLTLTNVEVNADFPVVVRKTNNTAIEAYKLVFEGANTLTIKGGGEYEVAIAKEEYDAVGKSLTALSNVTVEGADAAWSIFK